MLLLKSSQVFSVLQCLLGFNFDQKLHRLNMSAWPFIGSVLFVHPAVYPYEQQSSKFCVHRLTAWCERTFPLAQMS
jgi:hypothetical protein